MTEPWFNENLFGALWGGIVGGGGGTLAGLLGGLTGWLAPRGIGRRWILGAYVSLILLGVASLGFGLVALLVGQPYGIWYGPVLTGVLFIVIPAVLLPTVRRRYAEAEGRRLEAESLRQA